MSSAEDVPGSEKPGRGMPDPLEPPIENNFQAHLAWHLFTNGTRPSGRPGKTGDPWEKDEFAVAIELERRRTHQRLRRLRKKPNEDTARRNIDNWLSGKRCEDSPWALPLEKVLFGDNRAYEHWRVRFRNARRARPQEKLAAHPRFGEDNKRANDTLKNIELVISALAPQLEQAKRQGVTETTLRAIIANIDASLTNASISDILLYVDAFIRKAVREKRERAEPASVLKPLRIAAGELLDAGQLDRISEPFDAALKQRRDARLQREEHESREDRYILEEAARYDILVFSIERATERLVEASLCLPAEDRLSYLFKQISTLVDSGYDHGDNAALLASIGLNRRLLVDDLRLSASLHNYLCLALVILGSRETSSARLEEAVAECNASEHLKLKDDTIWAETQDILGMALTELGHRQQNADMLRRAVAAFHSALEVFTPKRDAPHWALIQTHLATAYVHIGRMLGRRSDLEAGVGCCKKSLQLLSSSAQAWVDGTSTLGNALMALSDDEGGSDKLGEAHSAFCAVLENTDIERAPFQWAIAKSMIGAVLVRLSEWKRQPALRHKAVEAFEQALTKLTRDRAPRQWGLVQANLGHTLYSLRGENLDVERLEKTERALRSALDLTTPDTDLRSWAHLKKELTDVLYTLGASEDGTKRLWEAFDECTGLFSQPGLVRSPIDWANSFYRLGTINFALVLRTGRIDLMENAISHFEVALTGLDPEGHSAEIAQVQEALALARKFHERASKNTRPAG